MQRLLLLRGGSEWMGPVCRMTSWAPSLPNSLVPHLIASFRAIIMEFYLDHHAKDSPALPIVYQGWRLRLDCPPNNALDCDCHWLQLQQ